MLLEAGANVNAPEGWALQTAAAEGHYDVVVELLRRGADVNAFTENENFGAGTALQGACEAGKTDIVSLLLEHNANPNLGGGSEAPPIIATTMRAEEEILELLVKAKADVDVVTSSGRTSTPLINAAAYMPQSSLQLLLDAGADINLPDDDGDTALIVAASRGDDEALSFLLDSGADIMHSNKNNDNALQVAIQYENTDCLKVLVDRIAVLLGALQTAMDSGNAAVTSVVRGAFSKQQELSYDDEPQAAPREVERVEVPSNDAASAPTEVPLSSSHNADNNIDNGGTFDEHSVFGDISEHLQSALANQAALWNEFTNKPPSITSTENEPSTHQSGGQGGQEPYQPGGQSGKEDLEHAEAERWTHDAPTPHPVELPAHGYIKRKPAPRVSSDGQAQYSQTPSPKPSESSAGRFQAPSDTNSYGQNITAYRPDQEAIPQQPQGTPSYQNPHYQNPQNQSSSPQPSAAYQNSHSYQPSQSSQSTTPYQAPSLQQNSTSLYDGSHYDGAAQYQPPTSQYPTQQAAFAAYNPDSYSPPAQQVPAQQQPYNPSNNPTHAYQGQAYQPQDWQQHQGYYGNASGQQYADNLYGGADWDRPQLKPQRSSFFTGGVKNTFDKAKIMGNGMFNRK